MKNIFLTISAFVLLAHVAQAQSSSYVSGEVYTASTDTNFIYAESLYFGPNTEAEINGVYVVYSKNIWIAPTAQISGTGKLIIKDPSTNPFYTGVTAGPTTIDGNNGLFINLSIENQNPSNIILADIADPGTGTINPTGSKAAALKIGKSIALNVDGGDIILNGNDLVFNNTGIITGFGVNRMVVTSNSIAGHVIKENTSSNSFVFPVGIAEGDYTPATITGANTYNVSVQSYALATPQVRLATEGMDRTWHVYGGTASTVALQHNVSTNGTAYTDANAFITRYQGNGEWSTGTAERTASGVHTNTSAIGGGIPAAGTANGSYLTKTSDPNSPLPITLISFDVNKEGSRSLIKWSTAHEFNNEGFEVERSKEGNQWEKIAYVSSLAEQGNSSSVLNYSVYDNQPLVGKNLYRLKQIDLDGKVDYSPIKMLQFDATNKVDIYPNPAQNHININGLLGNEAITIYNVNGQQVASYNANESKVQIDISNLVSGTYIIRISNQDGITTLHKFIKE